MEIKRVVFNPFRENTYLVWDDTKECIVVDAGNMNEGENRILAEMISSRDLKPVMAVNTHGHFDHLGGAMWLKEQYGVAFACSSKDQFLIDSVSGGMVYGIKCNDVPAIDVDLDAVTEVKFGNSTLKVIKTPGHTPGHVVLFGQEDKVLFTGDTLFRESIGRTDLPGGDYSWIMKSIIEEILPLGDDVTIYPGHEDASTIGHESLYNPFVVEVLNNEINYKG
ncbi:MAG: MBL fold metallo-hydrolase [Alistipes sp.]|nr:MBL fold metallo-hydrolase [Alistipes sp.]MBR5586285.1 MBL fold metallo-hydrolase [Alistipes sp.]MBR6543790.1 MBL fold metallo-hydrolase [Alistipes sp.]